MRPVTLQCSASVALAGTTVAAEIVAPPRLRPASAAQSRPLSRQIANRALHALQEAGLVRVQYGAIEVLNIDGLNRYRKGVEVKPNPDLPPRSLIAKRTSQ